jgi:hypothetical protein
MTTVGGLPAEIVGVPQPVAHEVERLRRAAPDGDLVGAVLAAAAEPESPLHPYFEWDDTAAAAEWRRVQASQLIRRVKVQIIPDEERPPIRARLYVAQADLGDGACGAYASLVDLLERPAESEPVVLSAIRRELGKLRAKYAAHRHLFEAALRQLGE